MIRRNPACGRSSSEDARQSSSSVSAWRSRSPSRSRATFASCCSDTPPPRFLIGLVESDHRRTRGSPLAGPGAVKRRPTSMILSDAPADHREARRLDDVDLDTEVDPGPTSIRPLI